MILEANDEDDVSRWCYVIFLLRYGGTYFSDAKVEGE
jgi:hypothetical protein